MVTYTATNWAKSKWDLSELPLKNSCLDKFPDLKDLFKTMSAAYTAKVPFEKIVRYVVLVYHRWSPYAIHQQNIIARKIEACEFIGLDSKDPVIIAIIANKDEFVNNSILWFLRMEANMPWLELQVYLESYYQITAILLNGDETQSKKGDGALEIANKKIGLAQKIKSIKSEIDALSHVIFTGDSDLLNFLDRFQEAEKNGFKLIVPEDLARYVTTKN